MEKIVFKGCFELGCDDKHHAYGYCNKHYMQKKRGGRVFNNKVPSLENEIWVDIEGMESCYQVSNMGRIKSLHRGETLRSLSLNSRGYLRFGTMLKGHRDTRLVHIEVARAFHKNVFNDKRVVFLDNDKSNCKASNLAWIGVYHRNKTIERLSAYRSEEAALILKCMNGDTTEINKLMKAQSKRLDRITQYYYWLYSPNSKVDLDSVRQEALIKACHAMQRGLLRRPKNINGWFGRIARNTLINAHKKHKNEISQWGFNNNGDEFDRIDLVTTTGLER